jgi:hypothetical protein
MPARFRTDAAAPALRGPRGSRPLHAISSILNVVLERYGVDRTVHCTDSSTQRPGRALGAAAFILAAIVRGERASTQRRAHRAERC